MLLPGEILQFKIHRNTFAAGAFQGATSVFRGHFMAWKGREEREGECSLIFYSLPLVARLRILKLFCVE